MKRLSVLIGCYGDFPQYSLRCVRSIVDNCLDRSAFDVHVGMNACGAETVSQLREMIDDKRIDSLIESRGNINKDPMMRLLVDISQTEYILWCDDDTHLLDGWDGQILRYINEKHPFEVAGHVHYCYRSDEYQNFLQQRPWWKGVEHYLESDHKDRVWFATGGLFLARAAYLREVNFPDRAMVKKQDDLLLGDCISQTRGRLLDFGRDSEIMSRVRISDGDRRGEGEGQDGWRNLHPTIGS